MLTEEIIEILGDRLTERINAVNSSILKQIGLLVDKFADLTPTQARQLAQILKYGGSYDKITRELARLTNRNVQDIYDMFEEVAKKDQNFAKQFYKYRQMDFIPYSKNPALKRQVKALADIMVGDYITQTSVIGFTVKDAFGNVIFEEVSDTYKRVIDEAVISVSQGKETFQQRMRKIMKELGTSGIKSVDYESGLTRRLDSATRMNLNAGLTRLHDTLQKQFGAEYGADGIEITTHENPAPDHQLAQGRHFSNENYEKLQNGEEVKDYKGIKVSLDHDDNGKYRPIGELNCYHTIFSIVLGVNEPEYNEKQLQQIIDDNLKGFEFEGKHYTNYQGTQLQRRLELEIRKEKEKQVLYRSAGETMLDDALKSQQKINILTDKYNELHKISGLPTKKQRMATAGYRKIKV